MSIIIFIIILVVLILVHELGHFLVAKKNGIRVDEFGLGYPPRIATLWRKNGTDYTLNAIPFGGFVKIFGENPDDESISGPEKEKSFVNKSRGVQASVLIAGVAFNIVFAWILISAGFLWGLPTPANYIGAGSVTDVKLIITSVVKNSPAEKADIKAGDSILSMTTGNDTLSELTPENVSRFITEHGDSEIIVSYSRGDSALTPLRTTVRPESGIAIDKKAIGISMDMIGVLKLPILPAVIEGLKTTINLIWATTIGLGIFIGNAILGRGDFSQVAGPVGIVGIVGDVTNLGFVYLLSFTAFISINLAVINLIPFPALDGGRLLFVAIEAIKRSPINPKIANIINTIGFALLIILMVVVTFHDIVKLF
ncbi:MAG: RIP metalloprotease RseP [Parcubacteria group bacterium]|nr:RIP metalloprotease RseP [Parcubacteria group bacterium]